MQQIYQCPNCGRTYTESDNVYYCGTCNHRLAKKEDIKEVKHPEMSKRKYNVIDTLPDPTKPKVECPYCHSTDTTKISAASKAGSVFFFGLFSQKVKHQWHCNKCGSDF